MQIYLDFGTCQHRHIGGIPEIVVLDSGSDSAMARSVRLVCYVVADAIVVQMVMSMSLGLHLEERSDNHLPSARCARRAVGTANTPAS